VARALRREQIGPEDVFVDIGCGMGRVLVQAARRPFGRVVGVDISSELIAIARQNLDVLGNRLPCKNVELMVVDALEWQIPDDATHLYLYNTVVGDALRRLIDNVAASYDRRPRRMRVFYANPVQDRIVRGSGRFRHVRVSRGLRRDRRIVVYEVVRATAAGEGRPVRSRSL
jgi:SAM-dependent methyltransferase